MYSSTVLNASLAAPAFSSCAEALQFGYTTSGTYSLRIEGTTTKDYYCDMASAGGGWTLVGNQAMGTNQRNFTGLMQKPDSVNSDIQFDNWEKAVDFYLHRNTLPHTELMFLTGDTKYYCVLSSLVAQATELDSKNTARVYAASDSMVSKRKAFEGVHLHDLYVGGMTDTRSWFSCYSVQVDTSKGAGNYLRQQVVLGRV